MRIRQRFSKFTAIGALGFLTDAGLFALMGGVGASPWVARAVSATTAITLTWALNRRFTFSDRQSHARIAEYSRYITAQLVGLVINMAVFALCIGYLPVARAYPLIALVLGAASALIVNYCTVTLFAFRGPGVPGQPAPHQDGFTR